MLTTNRGTVVVGAWVVAGLEVVVARRVVVGDVPPPPVPPPEAAWPPDPFPPVSWPAAPVSWPPTAASALEGSSPIHTSYTVRLTDPSSVWRMRVSP